MANDDVPIDIMVSYKGRMYPVQPCKWDTILEFKYQVGSRTKLSYPSAFSLWFKEQRLEDEKRVGDYGITEGSIVVVIPELELCGIPIVVFAPTAGAGGRFSLNLARTSTANQLKAMIAARLAIPPPLIRLWKGSLEIRGDYNLYSYYGVSFGTEITVTTPTTSRM